MLLECRDIAYRYPESENFVFQGASMRIDEPGFHALFGPSGVGKTSFARILDGAIAGYSGEIRKEGLDRILYTYNLERLPDWSNIGRHLDRVTPEGRAGLKTELVALSEMEDLTGSRFSKLSLGQRNRANLIRYLLQDVNLLIMDESLANVDERTREKIIYGIKKMFPDICFLYISHNIVEVARFCHGIHVLGSADKTPRITTVRGLNLHQGDVVQRDRLDRVMLEIMNAA
jgi:ABC-type nitrate/sulfonate/bicarbonate transport system ATPase subunit